MLAWVFTGRRRHAARLVFANLGRAYPRTGGPYVVRPTRVRRLHRLPDGLGLLDRRLGRQRRDRRRLRGLPDVFWPPGGRTASAAALVAIGAIWLLDVREHPRGARRRDRPGRDDRAEVRAARRDRHHRAVLHPRRATSRRSRRPASARATALLGHHRRDGPDAVGLHRPRVGDGAGRGGQGSREDHPAGDDLGTARTTLVYIMATVAIMGIIPAGRAAPVELRSPTPPARSSAASAGASASPSSRWSPRSAP